MVVKRLLSALHSWRYRSSTRGRSGHSTRAPRIFVSEANGKGSSQCWFAMVAGGGQFLVEGTLDEVADRLRGDYNPALIKDTGDLKKYRS